MRILLLLAPIGLVCAEVFVQKCIDCEAYCKCIGPGYEDVSKRLASVTEDQKKQLQALKQCEITLIAKWNTGLQRMIKYHECMVDAEYLPQSVADSFKNVGPPDDNSAALFDIGCSDCSLSALHEELEQLVGEKTMMPITSRKKRQTADADQDTLQKRKQEMADCLKTALTVAVDLGPLYDLRNDLLALLDTGGFQPDLSPDPLTCSEQHCGRKNASMTCGDEAELLPEERLLLGVGGPPIGPGGPPIGPGGPPPVPQGSEDN